MLSWLRAILVIALLYITYWFNSLAGSWKGFENIFYYFFMVLGIVFLTLSENLFSKKTCSFTTLDTLLTFFVGYVLIRVILESWIFWENEAFLVLITLYAVYFVFRQLFANAHSIVRFLVGVALLSIIASGHGILQAIGFLESNNSTFILTGTFVNPQVYGGYIASLLPFAIALRYFAKNSSQKQFCTYLSRSATILLLITLCLTQSRAAWLASLVSIGFLLQSRYHWLEKSRHLLTNTYVRVVSSFALFLFLGALVLLKPDSAAGRLLIWRISLPMGWDNFLLGVGYGQFRIHYLDYQASFFASHPGLAYAEEIAGMTYYAFNEFLQITLELGVVGLLLYVSLLVVAFKQTHVGKPVSERTRQVRTLAQSNIISILVFSLFSYPFSILPIHLLFFVSLALLSSIMGPYYTFSMNGGARLGLITLILACCLLGRLQWKRYWATKQWKQAAFAFSFNETLGISQYQKIYHTLAYKGEFLYNYGAELAEANYAAQSVLILEQTKDKFDHLDLHLYLGRSYQEMGEHSKAEQAYKHAMYMIPHRFLPRYLLVKLYQETRKREKAVTMANTIINMDAKVPSNITQEIKAEMKEFLKDVP